MIAKNQEKALQLKEGLISDENKIENVENIIKKVDDNFLIKDNIHEIQAVALGVEQDNNLDELFPELQQYENFLLNKYTNLNLQVAENIAYASHLFNTANDYTPPTPPPPSNNKPLWATVLQVTISVVSIVATVMTAGTIAPIIWGGSLGLLMGLGSGDHIDAVTLLSATATGAGFANGMFNVGSQIATNGVSASAQNIAIYAFGSGAGAIYASNNGVSSPLEYLSTISAVSGLTQNIVAGSAATRALTAVGGTYGMLYAQSRGEDALSGIASGSSFFNATAVNMLNSNYTNIFGTAAGVMFGVLTDQNIFAQGVTGNSLANSASVILTGHGGNTVSFENYKSQQAAQDAIARGTADAYANASEKEVEAQLVESQEREEAARENRPVNQEKIDQARAEAEKAHREYEDAVKERNDKIKEAENNQRETDKKYQAEKEKYNKDMAEYQNSVKANNDYQNRLDDYNLKNDEIDHKYEIIMRLYNDTQNKSNFKIIITGWKDTVVDAIIDTGGKTVNVFPSDDGTFTGDVKSYINLYNQKDILLEALNDELTRLRTTRPPPPGERPQELPPPSTKDRDTAYKDATNAKKALDKVKNQPPPTERKVEIPDPIYQDIQEKKQEVIKEQNIVNEILVKQSEAIDNVIVQEDRLPEINGIKLTQNSLRNMQLNSLSINFSQAVNRDTSEEAMIKKSQRSYAYLEFMNRYDIDNNELDNPLIPGILVDNEQTNKNIMQIVKTINGDQYKNNLKLLTMAETQQDINVFTDSDGWLFIQNDIQRTMPELIELQGSIAIEQTALLGSLTNRLNSLPS